MTFDIIVKSDITQNDRIEATNQVYAQPQIHDLGQLELVQGTLMGTYIDAMGRFYVFPHAS